VIAARRIVLTVVFLAAVWSGVWYTWRYATPIYQTEAILAVHPGLYSVTPDKSAPAVSRVELLALSQIALLQSEDVIRGAIATVGPERLNPPNADDSAWLKGLLPVDMGALWPLPKRELLVADAAFIRAKSSLTVRQESLTNLIRISFRHPSPVIAVEYTRALVDSFTKKYLEVYNNAAAASFFEEQRQQSRDGLARASSALAEFSSANQLFRIEEQLRILLDQQNRLASALQNTHGLIAEKEGQVAVIPQQLAQMKPISRVPQVDGLVRQLEESVGNRQRPANTQQRQSTTAELATNPPLLLVKVYQDTVATMVKLQTELSGLKALEVHQQEGLRNIKDALEALTSKEPEFVRLQFDVAQAKGISELFEKKAMEESWSQELNASKLSSVQLVQSPTPPLGPVWPRATILFGLGLAFSFVPIATFGLLHLQSRRDTMGV
jgi:polysaccharide biosynthesis transport protein